MRRTIAAALLGLLLFASGPHAAVIIVMQGAAATDGGDEGPIDPPEDDDGFIVFAGSTCSRDESDGTSDECTRHRRIFSTAESDEASVDVTVGAGTTCDPGAYSFDDPHESTWSAGEEGNRTFDLTVNAVAADCALVLEFDNLVNLAPYTERQTLTVTIVNAGGGGGGPAAQEYFISSTGNDSNDGLTALTPWQHIYRANDVPPSDDGHVLINIAAGSYRADEHIRPSLGGTDSSHMIKYCADGGDVTLYGNGGGGDTRQMTFENGVAFVGVDYDCPDAADTITIDGECTPVRGGTATGCGVLNAVLVSGQDLKLCHETTRTYGYTGFGAYEADSNRNTFCGGMSVHGNAIHDTDIDQDWGDFLYVREVTPGNRFLIDGGTTGIDWNFGGHTIIGGYGGAVTVRNVRMNNLWAGNVSGYSSLDGNRSAVFGTFDSQDWKVHDVLVNRTGKAQDSTYQEGFKCEGQRTGITDSVFRNPHKYFMLASSISSSGYAEDCFVAHSVFDNGGPIAVIEDYCDGDAGIRTVHGFKFKNNIAKNVAQAWHPSYPDSLFVIFDRCEGSTSYPIDANLLEVDGLSVQDTNCARLGVYIYSEGFYTMAALEVAHPDMVNNYTCSSDLDLDNAPAAGTNLTLDNMVTAYTPISDTESINQGVALTTTNGSGSSSTSLAVHNGCWMPNPAWGTPGRGQSSAGYRISLAGTEIAVSAVTMTGTLGSSTACRATFTLATPATWSNGAAVGLPDTGAPDRGLTH